MSYQVYRYGTPRFMDDSVYRSGSSSGSSDRAIIRDIRNPRSIYSTSPPTEYRNIAVDERGLAIDARSLYEASAYQPYIHSSRTDRDHDIRRANFEYSAYSPDVAPQYRQIRPRLCANGRYPPEFSRPRSAEELQTMSDSQLQRIMLAYELRRGSVPRYGEDSRATRMDSRARHAAYEDLFRYLGEDQLADDLRRRGRL